MFVALSSLGLGVSFLVCGSAPPAAGELVVPASARGKAVRQKVIRYAPREGDLIFFDDHNPIWNTLFTLADSGPPTHMGIVVKKPDGTLAVLEAGPDDTVWVRLLDLAPRLHQFCRDYHGTIAIRRCKVTLGKKKSAALTKFARAQDGKRYAVLRLLAQGTSLRARGPLEPLLAKTDLERSAWFCSELAVAAGTVAGLFDPKVIRANVTYPRDLIDNHRHDLRAVWEDAAAWRPGKRPEAAPAGSPGTKAAHAPRPAR